MSVSSDFKDLLSVFNAYHVRYLVVGGYAVVYYSEPRYTKDLDIWVSTDKDNAAAVFRALAAFGAPLAGLTEDDFAQEGYFYQMGVPPVRIDILMFVQGLTFEEAWRRHVETQFDGVPAKLISREDLITIKQAAGRPQDLIDVTNLSQSTQIHRGPRRPRRPTTR